MRRVRPAWIAAVILLAAVLSSAAENGAPKPVLWTDPGDIRSRNLFWGPGGEKHQPQMPVEFEKEDMDGTSPKFDVRDASGGKWRAKLGLEPRLETVSSRLMWAVGYT